MTDEMEGTDVTAALFESELVEEVGADAEEISGAAVSMIAVSLTTAPGSGAAATGGEGARFASGDDSELSVPIAEDAGADGDEGGGSGAALDWICWASEVVVEEVNSVEVISAASEVRVDMAAVRAWERVHRLPLTVVTDSCGVAMQKTDS